MPIDAWLRAFLLTLALEVPLVVLMTSGTPTLAWRRAAVAGFGQLATHPLVWFFFPFVPGLTGWTSFVASELFAWAAEAALYALVLPELGLRRAAAVSAVANGISMAIGLAL